MGKFRNPEFGELSQITGEGVFCKSGNGERKIFSWKEPEDVKIEHPILIKITMTLDKIECAWGKDGSLPSISFTRAE